jgi:hypothetical protein
VILFPISNPKAKAIFNKHSSFRGDFNLAIAAMDGKDIHGVIAMNADGEEFKLAHIYTDGNAQVGSLLYGAAWRTAKALGYKRVWI